MQTIYQRRSRVTICRAIVLLTQSYVGNQNPDISVALLQEWYANRFCAFLAHRSKGFECLYENRLHSVIVQCPWRFDKLENSFATYPAGSTARRKDDPSATS